MEESFISIELLGKYGVFWSNLAAEIKAFQLDLVTIIYVLSAMAAGKSECLSVVMTMLRVI